VIGPRGGSKKKKKKMSDNKRNSKYRHPRYYVIGLSDNAEQLQITTRSFMQLHGICSK
jgi:hypothetical protein